MGSNENRVKVETTNPARQCITILPNGTQCPKEIYAEGCKHCSLHGGTKELAKMQKRSSILYQLGQFQQRTEELAASKKATSARSEVALLRMTLEEVIRNMEKYGIASIGALMPQVKDVTLAIGKLLHTCQTIEMNEEAHVSKSDILALATGFVQIITKYVLDKDTLNKIQSEFGEMIETLFNKDEAELEDD